jgi:hypothetical protein
VLGFHTRKAGSKDIFTIFCKSLMQDPDETEPIDFLTKAKKRSEAYSSARDLWITQL